MNRVLITGGRAPVALDLARHFAAAGAEVFVADSAPCFLARASKAVRRGFRVPPPRQAPQAFAKAIGSIVRREKIELIVPTCEEVFFVARHAERKIDPERNPVLRLLRRAMPVTAEFEGTRFLTRSNGRRAY